MSDNWSTPAEIFDPLNEEFHFTLDVCAQPWNAKCDNFLSPEICGLTGSSWQGTCWINPPYGRGIGQWIRKAYESSLIYGSTIVCLLSARTETAWWHDYCMKGEVRFVRGRIHFTDENGKTGRPRFGNAVVIFRP